MTAYQGLADKVRSWRGQRFRPFAAADLSRELEIGGIDCRTISPRQLERVENAALTSRSAVVRALARHFEIDLEVGA